MSEKILCVGVTGGTGFIGQYLLREYAQDYKFVVVTSGASDKMLFQSPNIRYIVSDYSESSLIDAFSGCEAIVHLGAKRSDAESEKAFLNYRQNLEVSETLFRVAQKLKIDNVVNISSTAVYDKDMTSPFSEDDAVSPLSFYGVCKRSIELCAQLYNKRFGMCIKSLRLAQVIGEGERGGYMLAIFKERCINGQPLNVYGHGLAGKEYIYVKDVAGAIIAALSHPLKKGVFNIGTGVFTSNLELAQTFCKVFSNSAGYTLLTDKPEVVYNYCMNNEKARRELGFVCRYNLEEAIQDTRAEWEERTHAFG